MVTFFETRSYWQGGFTEDQQKYYKEYRLSEKGIYIYGNLLLNLIDMLETYALIMINLIVVMNLVAA